MKKYYRLCRGDIIKRDDVYCISEGIFEVQSELVGKPVMGYHHNIYRRVE